MNLKTQWSLEDELKVRTLELEQARSARFYAAEQLYLESERARELDGKLKAALRLIETYDRALNDVLELCPQNCEVTTACVICRTALRALEGET